MKTIIWTTTIFYPTESGVATQFRLLVGGGQLTLGRRRMIEPLGTDIEDYKPISFVDAVDATTKHWKMKQRTAELTLLIEITNSLKDHWHIYQKNIGA